LAKLWGKVDGLKHHSPGIVLKDVLTCDLMYGGQELL